MNDITLYGAGGHCYAAVALLKETSDYQPTVIYDDAPKEHEILGVPVRKYNQEPLDQKVLCVTIGNNKIRKQIVSQFDAQYPSFIHPSVVKYDSVHIGNGTLVLPSAVLDADVRVGDFCIVNNNATVSHNVRLGDYSHVAINAAIAGGVIIGEGVLIGAGSVILPEITIGKWAVIGAGAVVTKNIPDNAVAYGNPATIIRMDKDQ